MPRNCAVDRSASAVGGEGIKLIRWRWEKVGRPIQIWLSRNLTSHIRDALVGHTGRQEAQPYRNHPYSMSKYLWSMEHRVIDP